MVSNPMKSFASLAMTNTNHYYIGGIDTIMTTFAVLQNASRATMAELCSGPLIDVSHKASMVENLDIKAARNGGKKGGLRLSFGGLSKTSHKGSAAARLMASVTFTIQLPSEKNIQLLSIARGSLTSQS